MAGFYPDVPSPRIPYDIDGSIGFGSNGSSITTTLSAAQMRGMNNEVIGLQISPSSGNPFIGIIFPYHRDLTGVIFHRNGASNQSMQWSADSTNGVDGNWATLVASYNPVLSEVGNRTNILSVNQTGVKAVRWRWNSGLGGDGLTHCHLYGTTSAGENPDRLRMWHPTLDEPLDDATSADGAWLDWGDVVRGTSVDRTFRIKNNSATLTANSVVISTDVITNTTPTLESQITYSDGGAFAGSINIGTISPGATSAVITVRRTTVSNAFLSLWAFRTVVEAGSWS